MWTSAFKYLKEGGLSWPCCSARKFNDSFFSHTLSTFFLHTSCYRGKVFELNFFHTAHIFKAEAVVVENELDSNAIDEFLAHIGYSKERNRVELAIIDFQISLNLTNHL